MFRTILKLASLICILSSTNAYSATELCTSEPIGSISCDHSSLSVQGFADWDVGDWISSGEELLTQYEWSEAGLRLGSEFGAWYAGDRGALIAKGVGGNVAITSHINVSSNSGDGAPTTRYSSVGLLLATPISPELNNIFFDLGNQNYQSGLLLRSTENGNTHFSFQAEPTELWLRLCRVSTDVIALTSADGDSWQVRNSWSRPDLPSEMLLGIATNSWNGPTDLEADIDHLSYYTPSDVVDCGRSINPAIVEVESATLNFAFENEDELESFSLLHEVEGRTALHSALTIEQGRLSMQLFNSGWWMAEVAPLVFRDVVGDFIMTSRVTASSISNPGEAPNSHYNSAGLMVRNGLNPENWTNLVVGRRTGSVQMTHTRTINSNSQSDIWDSESSVEIRACRINGELHWLSRLGDDGAWDLRDVETIGSWPENLQLGMVATAWFGQEPDVEAQFDYLKIDSEASLERCYSEENSQVLGDDPILPPGEADTTPPTPTISTSVGVNTEQVLIPFTLDFGEIVSGVSISDFVITNGSVNNLSTLDNQLYEFTVEAAESGTVLVNYGADNAQDEAGNANFAAIQFSVEYSPELSEPTIFVLLQQDFEGLTNGDPWPVPWIQAENSPIVSATIQDGQACLVGPENNGSPVEDVLARMVTSGLELQDVDIIFEVTYENFHSQGVGFYGRQNGGFLTETTPMGQGYGVFLEGGSSDCLGLWYETNGDEDLHECTNSSDSLGLDLNQYSGSIPNDVTFNVRYQIEQISPTETIQRAKVWLLGSSEPDQWQAVSDELGIHDVGTNPMTIPELQNIAGGFVIDLYNYSGGGSTSACFDNITISELSNDVNPLVLSPEPVQVVSGFGFTEGVVWHEGLESVFFTDISNDLIYELNPSDDSTAVYRDALIPQRHANGLAITPSGSILVAEQSTQSIIVLSNDGSEEVLVSNWMGDAFNSPNDLVQHENGTIYFTDPTYGTIFNPGLSQTLGFRGVYLRQADGAISLIDNDFSQPNGIALSPDQNRLYVSDYAESNIRIFSLDDNGFLISELSDETIITSSNGDGMTVDINGNVYLATPDGVLVLQNDGAVWGEIELPEPARNVAFGGDDMRDLYIAAGTSIYRVRLAVPGLDLVSNADDAPEVGDEEEVQGDGEAEEESDGEEVQGEDGEEAEGEAPEIVSSALPLIPIGVINSTPATFTWQADPNAIWYAIVVQDSTGLYPINIGGSPEDAGCADGVSVCSFVTDIVLSEGEGQWWVRTWLIDESPIWSTAQLFDLNYDDPVFDAGIANNQAEAARFLMQATFGARAGEIAELDQNSYSDWIATQMSLPSTYLLPQLDENGIYHAVERLRLSWNTPLFAEDQLRQKVAMALSEIIVVSDVGILSTGSSSGRGMAYYNDTLVTHAFGNYRDMLEQVILSPIMGVYLSMLNNERPNEALNIRADENLAREIMQLFSIGLEMLNIDATPQLDGDGEIIPTYGHEHIKGLARVFTGWTWDGAAYWGNNPVPLPWYQSMQPFTVDGEESFHDSNAKIIVGHGGIGSETPIPAGLTAHDEMDLALDTIFNHPNVGPFLSKALIQKLITSNPSSAYIGRVASIFNDNGSGVRGDLASVVYAIFLDEEARLGHQTMPETFGKLREPMMRLWHLWRTFDVNTSVDGTNAQFSYLTNNLTQGPNRAPSVFNFFQTDYRSPDVDNPESGGVYVTPEFQINTESRLTNYQRLLSEFTHSGYVGAPFPTFYNISIDLIEIGNSLLISDESLLDILDLLLMANQMPDLMRASLLGYMSSLDPVPELTEAERSLRAAHLIYLVMSSPQYLIQR